MYTVTCRGMAVASAWLMAVALVSAQITFSRDWAGGKRGSPQLLDCSQFARLCRHFVHELKDAFTTEMAGKHRRQDPDKPPLYDDE